MGKCKRGEKERSREQELKYENSKLRREVSSLRKQLARLDLSRYNHVREILEEHSKTEESNSAKKVMAQLEHHWKCYDCGDGILEIIVYSKIGSEHYYRQCNCCSKRTKSKEYSPSVQGILKKKEE